ncbi:NEURL1B [Branchiostoma lanceolatum]|uniref:NEURL1B protein n=1 Tax=Branchiostoma lanceolatum TaxID=7740 RepID=A0A8J9ZPT9_BRALA|nr:NEURL1B [Branchiostoma lanceolatum]
MATARERSSSSESLEEPSPLPGDGLGKGEAEGPVDSFLLRQQRERMFELRRISHGDRPVSGHGICEKLDAFFRNHVGADSTELSEEDGQSRPTGSQRRTEERRPEAVRLEVRGLFDQHRVSGVLQSDLFRRELENVVRGGLSRFHRSVPPPPLPPPSPQVLTMLSCYPQTSTMRVPPPLMLMRQEVYPASRPGAPLMSPFTPGCGRSLPLPLLPLIWAWVLLRRAMVLSHHRPLTRQHSTHSHGSSNSKHQDNRDSRAHGNSNKAHGNNSKAHGNSSRAHGNSSRAHGNSSKAHGNSSKAHGNSSKAHGNSSKAHGNSSRAHGNSSRAHGNNSKARGNSSRAHGNNSKAHGNSGKAHGNNSNRHKEVIGSNPGCSNGRLSYGNNKQAQRENIVSDISELLQRQLVSSSLDGGFRGVLELMVARRVNETGTDGERVQESIQNIPRSRPHRRNDFSHLGISAQPQGAEADGIGAAGIQGPEMQSLRAQVEELKNMVRVSFDLQLDLQRAIRQEVAAAMATHTGSNTQDVPVTRAVREGHCLICLDQMVDSVLYQCGHMCVCNGCGLNLKSQGHNCPVCRAPIRDVIRAYRCNQD